MENLLDHVELPNGVKVANATPHQINFWSEERQAVFVVPSHLVVNAVVTEKVVALDVPDDKLVEFVTPNFLPESDSVIEVLKDYRQRDIYVIGSIIAAQAYPGLVFGMVPREGFGRVPPDQKQMRCDKFTMYE